MTGFPPFPGKSLVWTNESLSEAVARALLRSLAELQLVPVPGNAEISAKTITGVVEIDDFGFLGEPECCRMQPGSYLSDQDAVVATRILSRRPGSCLSDQDPVVATRMLSDGSFIIPEVLRSYMNEVERIV